MVDVVEFVIVEFSMACAKFDDNDDGVAFVYLTPCTRIAESELAINSVSRIKATNLILLDGSPVIAPPWCVLLVIKF